MGLLRELTIIQLGCLEEFLCIGQNLAKCPAILLH